MRELEISPSPTRRRALKAMLAASAAMIVPPPLRAKQALLEVLGRAVEIQITAISQNCFCLAIVPIEEAKTPFVPDDDSLVRRQWGQPLTRLRGQVGEQEIENNGLRIRVVPFPLSFTISSSSGRMLQQLELDRETGALSFLTGAGPILGLGEGGPQFDRRGSIDRMHSGQAGFELPTHGGRVPIPWLVGTSGWGIFIQHPEGSFDFTAKESQFRPFPGTDPLPLTLFFIASEQPATILSEYAKLTGLAELPPLWSLGYQQSHRTLESREEVLQEAKTFRQKKLPCDALIYLGTGFCPSGWNTANGSFAWNTKVFPDPEQMIQELHQENFHVVLHTVILTEKLFGSVGDRCRLTQFDSQQASCYWDAHRKDFAMGVDGWWPDEGDRLDRQSRLLRNRMYWEGPQLDRPNERPYALHRNGYAGMQRFGSFLWSGDVYSTWETLKTQVPIGINCGLSGIPYWGTDIGGFVPTKEFTAELYLRWFQFGAFCPLFRSHGRCWKLRLPWGWDTGDPGPVEIQNYQGAAIPDPGQLHNPQVEPICRKYLELRYRLLPYLYSAAHECSTTGMPILRALWLHYPEDPLAVARGDEYLWGRDLLVAPVVEPGAKSRQLYLPRGIWYDFWTGQPVEGGKQISRGVDLETIPLYIRGGAIVPLGPAKQHVGEKLDLPLSITIYPGADGSFLLYEDDGKSFDHRRGDWMGVQMTWSDRARVFMLRLAQGSRMRAPMVRPIELKFEQRVRQIEFRGQALEIRF
jgi:alpha-glucosidase (family GH31 glycosyl hydrolase)